MTKTGEIVNRVALSPLVSFDIADLIPQGERVFIDLKDHLFKGMILREKDIREYVSIHNWEDFQGKHVAIGCTTDAIIPNWAYMLLASALQPFAQTVVFGDLSDLNTTIYLSEIRKLNRSTFENKKVVVKGCGEVDVPTAAFVELTTFLRPIVDKLMFGEPCSTVPVYKKAKANKSNKRN